MLWTKPPAWIVSALLFMVCVAQSPLWAAPQKNASNTDPKSLIEDRHGEFHRLLNEEKGMSTEQIREGIRQVLGTFVDFDAVSRRALKKYFDGLKPKQQKRYIRAFKGLVQATYLKRLKPGSAYELLFDGEPELREGKARVRTIIRSGDSEAEVAYLLAQRADGAWRAYDIVIDEVSMARNYRKEFYRLMKEKGFVGLVDRIEERAREKEKEL